MRKKTERKILRASLGQRMKRYSQLFGMGIKGLLMCAVVFIIAMAVMAIYSPEALAAAFVVPAVFGTTLAANAGRAYGEGSLTAHPVIASDIIYEGAAVGNNGSGYARPLVAGDVFLGFAEDKVNNSTGSAGDLYVRTFDTGLIQLAVSGAVITDVDQPVYASDDDTFTFVAVSNSYVGTVVQYISSGVVIVRFEAKGIDPFGETDVRETLSDNKTIDVQDTGKIFYMDTDAKAITLPATAAGLGPMTFVNAGAFGTVIITISPNASDKIMGPDIAGADDQDLVNTKATARRGDFVTIQPDVAGNGWQVGAIKGTWV